jgi:hypothetical protein
VIPVTLLRFHIQPEAGFDLGPAPGSSLRGALYVALSQRYPGDETIDWLLRLEDTNTSGGKDVPRPIAVRPLLPGGPPEFSLAFYGRAIGAAEKVVNAVPTMGQVGVGRGRRRFTLTGVDVVHPLTGQAKPVASAAGGLAHALPQPPDARQYQAYASLMDTDTLSIRFLTPTRIVLDGHLCHRPLFRPWFQRLLERTRQIGALYADEPHWVPFRDLLAVADGVTIASDDSRWQEAWSGSRRDGMVKPVSGFIGDVTYRGDLAPLLPYVLLGQSLQVGKNTIKGFGWYMTT